MEKKYKESVIERNQRRCWQCRRLMKYTYPLRLHGICNVQSSLHGSGKLWACQSKWVGQRLIAKAENLCRGCMSKKG